MPQAVKITFETENDEFAPDATPGTIRVLREILRHLETEGMEPCTEIPIMDINGNRIGRFYWDS